MAAVDVRYSTANVTADNADAFPWEGPVPVSSFWDSLDYRIGRNFLINFTDDEIKALPIDQSSTASNADKITLLLGLLQEKAAGAPADLYETDHEAWYKLHQAIAYLQMELHLPEAEQTLRLLVTKTTGQNISAKDMLAGYLVNTGNYEEAEQTERAVLAWMEARPNLGKSSPQALHARRTIARALWGQGEARRAEAEALVAEIRGIVEGLGGGKFGVYQDEERELTRDMVARMDKGDLTA